MTEPERVLFPDDGQFPNSILPVLVYRQALGPESANPEALEALFAGNGWPPQWRSGILTHHHYHSTAHEALGVAAGEAQIMLGGPVNGRELDVVAGDVLVLPAGVAHMLIGSSADFLVVGAYPPGVEWDLLTSEAGERPDADRRIAALPVPASDPVTGSAGTLPSAWKA